IRARPRRRIPRLQPRGLRHGRLRARAQRDAVDRGDRGRDRAADRRRERCSARVAVLEAQGGGSAEVRRMKIPIIYNIRSLIQRPATTLATALGIAFVVLTFIGMLALANGFRAALVSTGRDDNVLVLRKGADTEISSGISREHAAILRSFEEIARLPDGRPMVSSDVYVVVAKPRVNGSETHMPVRGVSPEATAVRDR